MFMAGIGPIPEILTSNYVKFVAIPINLSLFFLGAYMAFRPLFINKLIDKFGEEQYAYITKSEVVCREDDYVELFLELRDGRKIRLGRCDNKRTYRNCNGTQVLLKQFKNFYKVP